MIAEMSSTNKLETPLEILDLRDHHWSRIAHAVYDRYAAHLGLEGYGLYAGLCRYANQTTAQCWPSLATLATKFGCTPKTIAVHLKRLIDVGLIAVTVRPGQSPLITLLAVPPTDDPRKNDQGSPSPTPVKKVPTPVKFTPEQDSLKKRENQDFSSSFSRKKKEESQSTLAVVVPPSLPDNPHVLSDAQRQAQCAMNLGGLAQLCATLWPGENVEVPAALPAEGCLHEHVHDLGHCNDCGEVLTLVGSEGAAEGSPAWA